MVEHAAFIFRLVRRYDIALSCLAGDRPTLYAVLAGRRSVGLVMPGNGAWWKRWLLSSAVEFDDMDTPSLVPLIDADSDTLRAESQSEKEARRLA